MAHFILTILTDEFSEAKFIALLPQAKKNLYRMEVGKRVLALLFAEKVEPVEAPTGKTLRISISLFSRNAAFTDTFHSAL